MKPSLLVECRWTELVKNIGDIRSNVRMPGKYQKEQTRKLNGEDECRTQNTRNNKRQGNEKARTRKDRQQEAWTRSVAEGDSCRQVYVKRIKLYAQVRNR